MIITWNRKITLKKYSQKEGLTTFVSKKKCIDKIMERMTLSERIIQQADISGIEHNLDVIQNTLENINSDVKFTNRKVTNVEGGLAKLQEDFNSFVQYYMGKTNVLEAKNNLIIIRQELEQKFGKYKTIREHAIGILQADDLGIVRKETISTATEELMIATPGYWLAPCLVSLAAWINDKLELAHRALKEGIRRNDEKTSLFFALICRRANRKSACLKWTQRYLANQNEENLDRKAIIVLDAYASGLLGVDTDGLIAKQIDYWIAHLSEKQGFIEQQIEQWSKAINSKRMPIDTSSYNYLRKYSNTWAQLADVLEGAYLHSKIFDYFVDIFNQKVSNESLKNQLDDILTSLVTDFDDEELPLKQDEEFNQLVVNFGGDKQRAEKNMQIKQSVFETHKDFTQLLTEAAMHSENAHSSVSTQKFAIALSRDWITDAYNDVIAQNRARIPHEIEINLETFNEKTIDGTNESELIEKFTRFVNAEKTRVLAQNVMSSFEKFCLYGGGAIVAIGVGMFSAGSTFTGLIVVIAGIGMVIKHFSAKKQIVARRQNIESKFAEKLNTGLQIIRALLAEVVDFRAEFSKKDAESSKVTDFLEQISPNQYVRNLNEGGRKIKI